MLRTDCPKHPQGLCPVFFFEPPKSFSLFGRAGDLLGRTGRPQNHLLLLGSASPLFQIIF